MTTTKREPDLDVLAGIIREHVQSLLDKGHSPSSVSFVLAFVATEMGLELAPNQHEPIRLVLGAILNASSQHAENGDEPDPELSDDLERPAAATIH